MLKILAFLITVATNNVMTAKILAVFPTPSLTHQNMYRTLIQELARNGHEVTLVTTEPFPKGQIPENITEIDFHDISYTAWRKYNRIITTDEHSDTVHKLEVAFDGISHVFEKQLKTDEMKWLIKEKHSYYDLLLLEGNVIPILSLSHIFKAPLILINPFGAALDNYEMVGAPTHPFLYPSNVRKRIYNLSIWEKIKELYMQIRLELVFRSSEKKAELMLKRHFGHDFPSLHKLKNNVDMLFLNINPIWAGNQPVPPNVILLGGIHSRPTEELPQNLQTFLDKSRRGVVYVSFGNNIKPSLLPPNKIFILLNVLSEIPYDIILKWDTDELPGMAKHIKVSKWLPQPTLLKHPNIKLFITQGGLQSSEEAIAAGVPLLGIPVHSDQWYNTEKYEHFHIGRQVDMATLTEETLIDAIQDVIRNESYRENIVKLREQMIDQPQTPLERAVWWIEYVLRHGGAKHLRAPAASMSWAEYYEMGFIFKLIFILFLIIVVFILSIFLLFRLMVQTFVDVKKKMP